MGKTGSGKTVFTKQLVSRLHKEYPFAHLYILDTKAIGDFDYMGEFTVRSKLPPRPFRLGRGKLGGMQVWQPPTNNRRAFDSWFRGIYEAREPAIVWLDDVAPVASKTSSPEHYDVLQKVGRGMGIGIISLIQETVDVPRPILSQANHLVSFRVSNDYDKRILKSKHEMSQPYSIRHKFGFWHSCLDDTDDSRYYGSYQQFF